MTSGQKRHDHSVAIIGGGFGGTLLALKLAEKNVQVTLIEPTCRLGRGLAYGAAGPDHRLNVPVHRMETGLQPTFSDWLQARRALISADIAEAGGLSDAFVPRASFGAYLEERLHEAVLEGRVTVIRDRVVSVARPIAGDPELTLRLEDGRTLLARQVVLATGNLPPATPTVTDARGHRLKDAKGFFQDPWGPETLRDLGPHEAILLIGTGLTMADMVMSLAAAGHQGPIVALSRRGLSPLTHVSGGQLLLQHEQMLGLSPRQLTKTLRQEARLRSATGLPWQRVLDAVRPSVAAIWAAWSLSQKRQALRHLRPYWDVHRHRLPPIVAACVTERRKTGQLTVIAGRLAGFEPHPDGLQITYIRRRQKVREVKPFHRVINCTGPDTNLAATGLPLFAQLRSQGLIKPDQLGLGLETDDVRVLDSNGQINRHLFALGGLTRPHWWEITAVPEMTAQINRLVRILADEDRLRQDPVTDFLDLGAGI